ncbi:hypothetical protein [[Clostridium] polysaccharolyticum]|uniref:Class IIb bacteriocin, lactobin A/cerein 7B family n=1 Tax=[Clostridium] polysaccharolyticum TaxID=29364 RepID=A0A1I0DQ45_9FIRM|nr:hypothetical protein [[Clostridium] polysaccharolyticum]SET34668.1 hypothetical protein SAMN04487772_11610 [[Clostridium] polysaccharolyticum]
MKKQYQSPTSIKLSGVENEYGAAIGAAAVWAIGIGAVWVW